MFPKKYSQFLFVLIMGFLMSLLMTLIITFVNNVMYIYYIQSVLKALNVSLPIAIGTALFVGPFAKKFVDKITK